MSGHNQTGFRHLTQTEAPVYLHAQAKCPSMKIPNCTYSITGYKFPSLNEEKYIYQKQKMAARVAAPSAEKGDNTGAAEYVKRRSTLDQIGTGFAAARFCVFEDVDRGWI